LVAAPDSVQAAATGSNAGEKEKWMSADWDADDLARLTALEHAFSALALISASNFAFLANITPSEAVARFRDAIEGAVADAPGRTVDPVAVRAHLKRMFDHLAVMARHADLGAG